MTDAEFMKWLTDNNPLIVHIEQVGDRWYSIERLMFHYTVKWGAVGDTINGYEDRWCIQTLPMALESFMEWKGRGFEGEPTLWHRHPPSGRRRKDVRDPSTEYVQD